MGRLDYVREQISAYWGGMLRLGATSIWETFDPREEGAAHYAMYGCPFGKSLCHAWGASPIYLLGKYFLGVDAKADGFTVRPQLGGLEWMEGTVPVQGGMVRVFCDGKTLRVEAGKNAGNSGVGAAGAGIFLKVRKTGGQPMNCRPVLDIHRMQSEKILQLYGFFVAISNPILYNYRCMKHSVESEGPVHDFS